MSDDRDERLIENAVTLLERSIEPDDESRRRLRRARALAVARVAADAEPARFRRRLLWMPAAAVTACALLLVWDRTPRSIDPLDAPPSGELLEYLGEWQTGDGVWVDPELLAALTPAEDEG